MVRVHMTDGPPREFDSNWHAVGGAGELTLSRVELREGLNPRTGRMETQISNPVPIAVLAPGTWDRLENLDLEEEAGPPALEVSTG